MLAPHKAAGRSVTYPARVATDKLLSTEQVATLLGVSPSRVRQLVREGLLRPESLAPRAHLFRPEAIETYRAAVRPRRGRPKKTNDIVSDSCYADDGHES